MSCKYCNQTYPAKIEVKIQAGTYMLDDMSYKAKDCQFISDDDGYGLMITNDRNTPIGYIDAEYCLKCGRKLDDYKE